MNLLSATSRLASVALFGFTFVVAQAQSNAAPLVSASSGASSSSSSSVWSGAWLGLVTLSLLVVLVAVVVWLFRRGTQSTTVGGQIQLLATFPIGPRERLVVVRMQDRILALGHTPTHISLLTELDDFEPMPGSGSLPSGFAGQLMTLLSGKNGA